MGAASSLEMNGLPSDLEEYIRRVHCEFLKRHGLKDWPLQVRLSELEPVINQPQKYWPA